MQNTTQILFPEATYHVYNRANGNERLFLRAENYRYFLQKYQEYISPVAETYCYCLMPNHFHFLLRIKSKKDLMGYYDTRQSGSATLQGFKTLEGLARQTILPKLVLQNFSHFFNGYTQAFNKQHLRKGSLFMHPFKRKAILDTSYLLNLIRYIHQNPVEAGLCQTPEEWPHSSYPALISNNQTFIRAQEVINWFDSLDNFRYCHSQTPELSGIIQLHGS